MGQESGGVARRPCATGRSRVGSDAGCAGSPCWLPQLRTPGHKLDSSTTHECCRPLHNPRQSQLGRAYSAACRAHAAPAPPHATARGRGDTGRRRGPPHCACHPRRGAGCCRAPRSVPRAGQARPDQRLGHRSARRRCRLASSHHRTPATSGQTAITGPEPSFGRDAPGWLAAGRALPQSANGAAIRSPGAGAANGRLSGRPRHLESLGAPAPC